MVAQTLSGIQVIQVSALPCRGHVNTIWSYMAARAPAITSTF